CDMLDTVGIPPALSDLLIGVPGMVVMVGGAIAIILGADLNILGRPGPVIRALSLISIAYGESGISIKLSGPRCRFLSCFLIFSMSPTSSFSFRSDIIKKTVVYQGCEINILA